MRVFICVSKMCNYTSYSYEYNLQSNLIFHTCVASQCNTIVHFKRLGSRHFVKEMKIQSSMLRYNMILRKTNLQPFQKYIQMVSTHPDYQI